MLLILDTIETCLSGLLGTLFGIVGTCTMTLIGCLLVL